LVDYRFDIKPKALSMAIPRNYNGPLFSKAEHNKQSASKKQQAGKTTSEPIVPQEASRSENEEGEQYPITVIGVVPYQEKEPMFIVAGNFKKQSTDETVVVAARVTRQTIVLNKAGEQISPSTVLELQEGQEVLVQGEKTKRGVIKASSLKFLI
jgi:hypothetical protein